MSTIMIIDDEKDIRDSLEGVFKDEGYPVVVAEGRRGGFRALNKESS